MRLELTRRGDYAIRAMLSIAANDGQPPISVRRIATAMAIPAPMLPQVMRPLVRAGLVTAQIGRAGGYRLGRPAGEISLLTVIEAIEGDTRRQTCVLRGGPCSRDGHCAVHEVFFRAQEAVRDQLGRATLGDVIASSDGVILRQA